MCIRAAQIGYKKVKKRWLVEELIVTTSIKLLMTAAC